MIETFMKIIDPNFINAELIGEPGAYIVVTIKDIDYREAFNKKTNQSEMRQALIFEGDTKPLLLNKTNAKTLKRLFSPNEDKPENCVGHEIELYVERTKVGREMTTGIRIREHAGIKCEECGAEIRPQSGKTSAEIAEIAKRNTGKVLCVQCMRKYAEQSKGENE